MSASGSLEPAERRRREEIVIREYNGIAPTFEAFYLQSLLHNARASDDAFERFALSVAEDSDHGAIVSSVEEALTYAAALSRFFWPVAKTNVASARATKLRDAFDMDGSPLQDRRLRNALEHFDERLDEFLLGDSVGLFFPEAMVGNHRLVDEVLNQVCRFVDPSAMIFVILGEKYDFGSIRDEVRRIITTIRVFDNAGGRLQAHSVRETG